MGGGGVSGGMSRCLACAVRSMIPGSGEGENQMCVGKADPSLLVGISEQQEKYSV